MMWNATSYSAWRLYAILDHAAAGGRDLAWLAQQAIAGGADVLQLRHKDASTRDLLSDVARVRPIAKAAGIPLIINDRADVALAGDADGVHVGQDDLPVSAVRRLGPARWIVGKSTHSFEQAMAAANEPVDYIALGPIYATPTKPDSPHVGLELIPRVTQAVRQPVVVIGGIDHQTLPEVLRAGARCAAVVRAICAADDPAEAARRLKTAMAVMPGRW